MRSSPKKPWIVDIYKRLVLHLFTLINRSLASHSQLSNKQLVPTKPQISVLVVPQWASDLTTVDLKIGHMYDWIIKLMYDVNLKSSSPKSPSADTTSTTQDPLMQYLLLRTNKKNRKKLAIKKPETKAERFLSLRPRPTISHLVRKVNFCNYDIDALY